MSVVDQGLGGHADASVAEICKRESRALVTLRSIASIEPRLQAIASPLDREAVASHEPMAEQLMAASAAWQARSVMSDLTFAPKAMPAG
jgi:hypothetical protein